MINTCNNMMVDHVKLFNLNLSTNNNTIDLTNLATAVAIVVSISNLVAILKFGSFTPHDIKQYIHSVLTQMNTNNYFFPLLTTDFQSVLQTATITNLIIDSALYISLNKSIPPYTLNILAMGNNNKSGVYIIKNFIARTLTPKSAVEVNLLYLKW